MFVCLFVFLLFFFFFFFFCRKACAQAHYPANKETLLKRCCNVYFGSDNVTDLRCTYVFQERFLEVCTTLWLNVTMKPSYNPDRTLGNCFGCLRKGK